MTTIGLAQLSDAKALLSLAQGLATSFVVDPQAFDIALPAILSDSSSYLAVADDDRDNWQAKANQRSKASLFRATLELCFGSMFVQDSVSSTNMAYCFRQ